MMISVQNIGNPPCTRIFAYPMEEKTVCQVFKKGPEYNSTYKNRSNGKTRNPVSLGCIIWKIDYHRQVHTPDYQRMCFGKEFLKVFIFKNLCLALIMNFIEFHKNIFYK